MARTRSCRGRHGTSGVCISPLVLSRPNVHGNYGDGPDGCASTPFIVLGHAGSALGTTVRCRSKCIRCEIASTPNQGDCALLPCQAYLDTLGVVPPLKKRDHHRRVVDPSGQASDFIFTSPNHSPVLQPVTPHPELQHGCPAQFPQVSTGNPTNVNSAA